MQVFFKKKLSKSLGLLESLELLESLGLKPVYPINTE